MEMPDTLYTDDASTTPLSATGSFRRPTMMVDTSVSSMELSDCSASGAASHSSLPGPGGGGVAA